MEALTRRTRKIIHKHRMERPIRPDGKQAREVVSFRWFRASVDTIDFYARSKNLTRSDALRVLVAAGLASEGY